MKIFVAYGYKIGNMRTRGRDYIEASSQDEAAQIKAAEIRALGGEIDELLTAKDHLKT